MQGLGGSRCGQHLLGRCHGLRGRWRAGRWVARHGRATIASALVERPQVFQKPVIVHPPLMPAFVARMGKAQAGQEAVSRV